MADTVYTAEFNTSQYEKQLASLESSTAASAERMRRHMDESFAASARRAVEFSRGVGGGGGGGGGGVIGRDIDRMLAARGVGDGLGARESGGRSGRVVVGEYTRAMEGARAETDRAESSLAKLAARTALYGFVGRQALRGVTASLTAFGRESEDGAAKLAVMSGAWEQFKAGIGRDILSGDGGGAFGELLGGVESTRRALVDFVADAAVSVASFSNAFGGSSADRAGQVSGEQRARQVKAEVEAIKEAAKAKKDADEQSKRAADEAAREAERARDLAGRARIEQMNLKAEAARLDGDEGLAGSLQRAADLEEKKLAIARQYTDEKQKQALREATIVNAGRAEDAARREEARRLRDVNDDAAGAVRASLLGGFGGNNATSGAGQLASLRFAQAEEVRRLRERGAAGDVIDQLVGAQGAEERALIGSLVRGTLERRQLSKSVGAGLGGVLGLSGQVVGGDRGEKAKAEAAARRLEELAGKMLEQLKAIGKNTAEVGGGLSGGVAVFG